jgi:hypothetical protein
MSASFTPPSPAPLTGVATSFVTVRFDRTKTGDARFAVLPNVQCVNFQYRKGPTPHSAQFEYILDSTQGKSSPFPFLMEQLWPLLSAGPYVVQNDDELIVYALDAAGNRSLVFNGFASIPQADMAKVLNVTFSAQSVHIRLWDNPIFGAIYRDADDPKTGNDVPTDKPVFFNPTVKGKLQPNCTPDGWDVNEGAFGPYPVFLDAHLPAVPGADPTAPTLWTLGPFIRHIFEVFNTTLDPTGDLYVDNPDVPDTYLQSPQPTAGGSASDGPMDLSDDTTYTLNPIVIRSYDATNKALPDAAAEQLHYHGFEYFHRTQENPSSTAAGI